MAYVPSFVYLIQLFCGKVLVGKLFPNLIKYHYFCSTSGEEEEERSSALFKAVKRLLRMTI